MSEFLIYCDGGIKGGNPGGRGYGSFCQMLDSIHPNVRRVVHGTKWNDYPMTSILAEILTATDALLYFAKHNPESLPCAVEMRCDCRWVVKHLMRKRGWSQKPHLVLAHHEFTAAAKPFASVRMRWHRRTNSVDVLGH